MLQQELIRTYQTLSKVSYQKNAIEKIFAFSLQNDIIRRIKNISSNPIIRKF
jgi:hypothetical protein